MTTETALTFIADAEIIETHPNASALVLPVADPESLVHAMQQYQLTKNAILDRATDYQSPPGEAKPFIKKSGWAKLAIAFGVSVEQLGREKFYDEAGTLVGAEFQMRAIAPNGRHADGWGYCSIHEPRYTNRDGTANVRARQKIEHDIPATARTRAVNIAYSTLFGHGEVSFEEADGGGDSADPEQGTAKRAGRSDVPKASPYHPASANQLATATKLARLLGRHYEPTGEETSAEISDVITDLSREYNERKGGTPVGQRYSPAQMETMPEAAKQEAARARADIASSVAAIGGGHDSTAVITQGQKTAITKLAPQAGDIVPENLAEWSYLEAAAYITSLQERIDAAKKVTA